MTSEELDKLKEKGYSADDSIETLTQGLKSIREIESKENITPFSHLANEEVTKKLKAFEEGAESVKTAMKTIIQSTTGEIEPTDFSSSVMSQIDALNEAAGTLGVSGFDWNKFQIFREDGTVNVEEWERAHSLGVESVKFSWTLFFSH